MKKTGITIVQEYFPELNEEQADHLLWDQTGWPCWWEDCDESCDHSTPELAIAAQEKHLRYALQKLVEDNKKGSPNMESAMPKCPLCGTELESHFHEGVGFQPYLVAFCNNLNCCRGEHATNLTSTSYRIQITGKTKQEALDLIYEKLGNSGDQ